MLPHGLRVNAGRWMHIVVDSHMVSILFLHSTYQAKNHRGALHRNARMGFAIISLPPNESEGPVKIEDVMKVIENYMHEAEKAAENSKLSVVERSEAKGEKKAYAHCIGLVQAVLEKKGWTGQEQE
jgi:hypothetical protein